MLKRFISAVLLVCFISSALCASADMVPWDGYKEPPREGDTKVLVDLSNVFSIMEAGGIPSQKYTKNGNRNTAHWNNHEKNTDLDFHNVARDWSDCEYIVIDMYSEKATQASVNFVIYADYVPTPGKTISYFLKTFKLNFEGWKQFKFQLSDFNCQNYADWSKITSAYFNTDGWNATPDPESDVYVNSIYGKLKKQEDVEGEVADPLTLELSEKGEKEVFDALGDNIAVMNFSGNAIINGKVVPMKLENKISTANDESIAPVSFFTDVLGAEVDTPNGNLKVTYDGVTADLTSIVQKYDNGEYVPLNSAMEKLGKQSSTTDTVTIIGDAAKTAELVKTKNKLNNLKVMLSKNKVTANQITKADWAQVRANWRKFLVGDEGTNLDNEYIKKKIQNINNACKGSYKIFNRDSKILAIFGTTPVAATSDMTAQTTHLLNLVKAYGTYGSDYYKDPQLKDDILFSFEWIYQNLYGPSTWDGTGWKEMGTYNWWDWYNGTPVNLGESFIIMYDEMPRADVVKYAEVAKYAVKHITAASASRIYVVPLNACLLEDYEWMNGSDMIYDYNSMFTKMSDIAGVQEDGVYRNHTYYAYTSHYGVESLLDRLTRVQGILAGTKFELATPHASNPRQWMYNTFAPVTFNGAMTTSLAGRAKAVGEFKPTAYYIAALVDYIDVYGKDDAIKFKELIKRNVIPENINSIIDYLEIDQLDKFTDIMADDSIADIDYNISKVHFTGDNVVHQKDDIGFAVNMSSTRIARWESITGSNYKGWYQGDGMLYTYSDEEPNAYSRTFWQGVNPYHLPGTTVDTQERIPATITDSSQILGGADFVGGAELERNYSTVAMDFVGHNNENKNAYVTTGSVNHGDAPYHKSTLKAKKSWFLFDDEAVALGSNISANDGFEVQTVIENRLLDKIEKKAVTQDADADYKTYDVVSLVASDDDGNVPENMLDGYLDTRWSAEGDQYAIFELEEAVPIGYVGIATYNGNNGNPTVFELETSVDGENWTTVFAGQSSGTTASMEAYDMKGTVAKYVKYNGHGRTTSLWNSLTEFRIFAPTADGSMPVDGKAVDDRILGAETITVDGKIMEKESTYTKSFIDPKWFNIEGTGGYYLPNGGNVVIDKVVNQTTPFLEAWFTHGKSPKGQSYAYVVLPKKSADETAAYAANPDIKILAQTDKVHAVRETTLGVTGIVLWEAGTFEDITTDIPMIITTEKKDGLYKLAIAEPSQIRSTGTVTVAGNWEVVDFDPECQVESSNGKTVITFEFENERGRSFPVTLKSK